MTSHIKTLATGLLLAIVFAGPVQADPSYAVVHDSEGAVVRNTTGNCVRTKWLSDKDVCPHGAAFTQDERTVYFEFNKSVLTKEAKVRLDALIAKIKAVGAVEGGQLVGYADRIGTPGYNEKLSKKRVETVRAYMAAHGLNMKAAKTRWLGDTEPTTNCPKDMKRKELIRCLQADRRVEVELVYDP
jgi:outer membrane protein OmpA-like peptidoglycan-associated protein